MVVRTTRITIETDLVMVVRQARTALAWCPMCQARMEVITLDDAGFPELGAAAHILEWLETGNLHLWQLPGGPTRICLASLLRCFEIDGLSKIQIAKEST